MQVTTVVQSTSARLSCSSEGVLERLPICFPEDYDRLHRPSGAEEDDGILKVGQLFILNCVLMTLLFHRFLLD